MKINYSFLVYCLAMELVTGGSVGVCKARHQAQGTLRGLTVTSWEHWRLGHHPLRR